MFDFGEALRRAPEQTVLCVGDLMLDSFVYGEVARISPEAPAPVVAVSQEERMIGGAGNVARNIASLGARCIFVGMIGKDETATQLASALADFRLIEPHLVVDASRPTTRKMRFVSEHHATHLLRADWERATPAGPEIEDQLIAAIRAAMPRAGIVVLSDYAKGVLTPRVIAETIAEARRRGKRVLVDPKGNDYSVYRGATLITPNRRELANATRRDAVGDEAIMAAAAELARMVEAEAVLVTRSEEGMSLHVGGRAPVHIAAYPVKVRDLSGPGDTVIATASVLLALGADYEAAMRGANAAAAVVVGKRGTASVTIDELRHRLLPAAATAREDKVLFDWRALDDRLAEWRRQRHRIGFTNGCFDLLHPGHVRLLTRAREACDRLIVGLNSDASARRLKGEGRPVQPVEARAEVLAALEAVDLVVVFEEDTPLALIKKVQPSLLVKGGDYKPDEVVGRAEVEAAGGELMLVELVPGQSTTAMVARSRGSI